MCSPRGSGGSRTALQSPIDAEGWTVMDVRYQCRIPDTTQIRPLEIETGQYHLILSRLAYRCIHSAGTQMFFALLECTNFPTASFACCISGSVDAPPSRALPVSASTNSRGSCRVLSRLFDQGLIILHWARRPFEVVIYCTLSTMTAGAVRSSSRQELLIGMRR
jgi:hypothetical protein